MDIVLLLLCVVLWVGGMTAWVDAEHNTAGKLACVAGTLCFLASVYLV